MLNARTWSLWGEKIRRFCTAFFFSSTFVLRRLLQSASFALSIASTVLLRTQFKEVTSRFLAYSANYTLIPITFLKTSIRIEQSDARSWTARSKHYSPLAWWNGALTLATLMYICSYRSNEIFINSTSFPVIICVSPQKSPFSFNSGVLRIFKKFSLKLLIGQFYPSSMQTTKTKSKIWNKWMKLGASMQHKGRNGASRFELCRQYILNLARQTASAICASI